MTLAAWPDTFAGGRDEDEVLLEWLKSNLPSLSTEEKRSAVRRLCGEFGYTTRGLVTALGLSESAVRYLRVSDQEAERIRELNRANARRNPRVWASRVVRLADAWQERAAGGLTADEANRLLGELRALIPSREES